MEAKVYIAVWIIALLMPVPALFLTSIGDVLLFIQVIILSSLAGWGAGERIAKLLFHN